VTITGKGEVLLGSKADTIIKSAKNVKLNANGGNMALGPSGISANGKLVKFG